MVCIAAATVYTIDVYNLDGKTLWKYR